MMHQPVTRFAKDVMTIADIASAWGCSVDKVRRQMRRPELRFPRPLFSAEVSRLKLFDRREVEAWLHRRHEENV